jgi:hypothetical protein
MLSEINPKNGITQQLIAIIEKQKTFDRLFLSKIFIYLSTV